MIRTNSIDILLHKGSFGKKVINCTPKSNHGSPPTASQRCSCESFLQHFIQQHTNSAIIIAPPIGPPIIHTLDQSNASTSPALAPALAPLLLLLLAAVNIFSCITWLLFSGITRVLHKIIRVITSLYIVRVVQFFQVKI